MMPRLAGCGEGTVDARDRGPEASAQPFEPPLAAPALEVLDDLSPAIWPIGRLSRRKVEIRTGKTEEFRGRRPKFLLRRAGIGRFVQGWRLVTSEVYAVYVRLVKFLRRAQRDFALTFLTQRSSFALLHFRPLDCARHTAQGFLAFWPNEAFICGPPPGLSRGYGTASRGFLPFHEPTDVLPPGGLDLVRVGHAGRAF